MFILRMLGVDPKAYETYKFSFWRDLKHLFALNATPRNIALLVGLVIAEIAEEIAFQCLNLCLSMGMQFLVGTHFHVTREFLAYLIPSTLSALFGANAALFTREMLKRRLYTIVHHRTSADLQKQAIEKGGFLLQLLQGNENQTVDSMSERYTNLAKLLVEGGLVVINKIVSVPLDTLSIYFLMMLSGIGGGFTYALLITFIFKAVEIVLNLTLTGVIVAVESKIARLNASLEKEKNALREIDLCLNTQREVYAIKGVERLYQRMQEMRKRVYVLENQMAFYSAAGRIVVNVANQMGVMKDIVLDITKLALGATILPFVFAKYITQTVRYITPRDLPAIGPAISGVFAQAPYISALKESVEERDKTQLLQYNYHQQPYIIIDQLTASVPGKIKKVDMSQQKIQFAIGKVYEIIGPSGQGKSTLFDALTHILAHSSGRVTLPESYNNPFALYYIPQKGLPKMSQLTLLEFLTPSYPSGLSKEQREKVIGETLRYLEPFKWQNVFNKEAFDKPVPTTLSGAQQRMLLLVRGMLNQAKWIFMDEGLGAFDTSEVQGSRQQVMALLKEYMRQYPDVTLFTIHHPTPGEQDNFVDELLVFEDMQLKLQGKKTPPQVIVSDSSIALSSKASAISAGMSK